VLGAVRRTKSFSSRVRVKGSGFRVYRVRDRGFHCLHLGLNDDWSLGL
jgi:hypothetical protein